jgi:hypothetical protein
VRTLMQIKFDVNGLPLYSVAEVVIFYINEREEK